MRRLKIGQTALILVLIVVLLVLLVKDALQRRIYPVHYTEYVSEYCEQYDVPPSIVYAVIRTESNFETKAISSAGAIGLMQITPETFKWLTEYHLKENLSWLTCYDAKTNIRYGVYYLSYLYDRYGRWPETLAAYNAGPGRVDRWLEDPTLVDDAGRLIVSRIPYQETKAYVNTVLHADEVYDYLYSEPKSNES